jgi:E3 ubiquitin-protein ligase SHPRH
MRIPVLIKSQITALPSPSADLQQDSGGEISRVDLQITDLEGRQLLPYSCENSQLFELLEQIELASRLTPAERFISRAPTVCYQAHLCTLPNGPYLGLETVVLWADSLEVPDIKYMQLPVLEVFTKYVLQQEFSRPTTSTEQRELRESLLGVSREWTPREFYDSVHVPQTPDSAAASLRCPGITCDLFPFQKRAVRWLLRREGKDVQQDGRIVSLENPPKSSPPASFDSQKDADGRYYYFSQMFMTLTTDTSQWHDAADHLRGGILAEEMGLGKTVEMIALMCLNRREPQPKPDPDGLKYSGATLIITPPAILEQWKQELEKHAPSLRVYYYPGITAHRERQNGKAKTLDDEEMVNELAEADVVLTTYTVISKEIHYAGAVKRNLRHEKRFEQRKTPLIRISWWRVCLDEAQMIESGVSHAAQVARVIPREIAWAVTGTPLRKNIDDLFGLLLFLHYGPYCYSNSLWKRLYSRFGTVLVDIIGTIALRHSKDRVRDELRLPPQKRIVITTPFTAIEEQHYGQLFEQMSMECGLNTSGAPLRGDWDPDDPRIIEKMRSWLTRLRQTCLHPDIGGNNRRTLGSNGPLRTVNEVLDVMIEANEAAIRSEERILLLSQLRRGQLLENAKRRQEALDLWQKALDHSTELVEESRKHLRYIQESEDHKNADNLSEDAEEADKNSRLGQCRLRLRGALEVQHIAVFFTANAYYQIKSDPNLTQPDSDEFKALEKREEDGYEAAKVIRKEMLTDISRKVERHMKIIKDRIRTKQFVNIPKMKPQIYSRGIEAYDLICNFEDLCEALNKHSEQYKEWRDVMIKLVSQSLIDQEDEAELEGNEYERSTKHQDEMYVYMEALRAMYADRHDCLTGQKNILISHEVKAGIIQAQKDEGPSPKLFLEIMNTRSQLVPDPKFGSLRKVVSDLRSLLGTLHWQANSGNSRARAEHEVVEMVLRNAGQIITEQLKVSANLEKEVEMFRDAMNNRLEYYRHLQQISDTVAPYDEEAAGQPLDEEIFAAKLAQEEVSEGKISTLKSKARYLIHLRDDGSSDPSARICIICQSTFETGEYHLLKICGMRPC